MTQQINRRTVTKGIAWSVPAIAVAGAAPAFAASGTVTVEDLGLACKAAGNSCKDYGIKQGYAVRYRICSTYDVAVEVKLSSVTLTIGTSTYNNVPVSPDTITFQPGDPCRLVDVNIMHNNSANTNMSAVGTFTVTDKATGEVLMSAEPYEASSNYTPNCPYPGNGDNCLPGAPGATSPVVQAVPNAEVKDEAAAQSPEAQEPAAEQAVVEEPAAAETEEDQVELTVEEPAVEAEVLEEDTE